MCMWTFLSTRILVPGCVEEGEESRDPRSRLCGGGGGEQGPPFPVVWRRGRRAGTPVPGCVEEGEESRDPRSQLCGGGGGGQGPPFPVVWRRGRRAGTWYTLLAQCE